MVIDHGYIIAEWGGNSYKPLTVIQFEKVF